MKFLCWQPAKGETAEIHGREIEADSLSQAAVLMSSGIGRADQNDIRVRCDGREADVCVSLTAWGRWDVTIRCEEPMARLTCAIPIGS